jgi:serine/threonine protein kinase/Tol biopolymer transport system component
LALHPGTRLGPYEITAPLGVGGMGEVYRATDTNLKRQIAIKVLPAAVAGDSERLARFQREAEILAALNHPNIAHIYGLERQEGRDGQEGSCALVMELVEGPTLADRIARLRAPSASAREAGIPIDEALSIARQIAEALEAAHEQGIIHRDLKPANIKVREDGTVKVLDFGLAKAMESPGAPSTDAMNSPTISMHATQAGIILGTAAYMAPEQARGKAVDRRADIWAFGVVLFEMLSGHPPFPGDDISQVLARVIDREPDWAGLPVETPPRLRQLVRRCLEKDAKRRLRDIGEARVRIEDLLSGARNEVDAVRTSSASRERAEPTTSWRHALPWFGVAASLAAAGAMLMLWAPWHVGPQVSVQRLSAELGADASLPTNRGLAAVLSPDGKLLAFVGDHEVGGEQQLYVRRLDQLSAAPIAGTDGASAPFFSPDGQWIAFFTGDTAGVRLKKVPVAGGAVVTLSDAVVRSNTAGLDGAWTDAGEIVLSSYVEAGPGAGIQRLFRVPTAGGKAEPVTTSAEGQSNQRWPQMLPGGKAVLYTSNSSRINWDDADIVVQPFPGGAPKIVQRGGFYARYLESGHLVYIHDGGLFAAPFDLDRLEVTGPAVPAIETVVSNSSGVTAGGQFAVSRTGTLVYMPARSAGDAAPIQWMDRDGKTTPLRATPANWSNLVFSPDGRMVAMEIADGRQRDVWVYDWERGTTSRLTFEGDGEKPVWTPDGRRLVFRSALGDKSARNLYWKRSDGTGETQRLTESKNSQGAWSWHPSGKFLAFHENDPRTRDDVLILPMEGDEASGWKPGKPIVFLNSTYDERDPMFSPDGRWLAYTSNETGRDEVYVRPFQHAGGKFSVSTGGGTLPTWSLARHELFYAAPDGHIMVATYAAEGDAFRAEKPQLWSDGRFMRRSARGAGPTRSFDLHPDGNRFALSAVSGKDTETKQDKLVFVFNFFDELRRIAPSKK